MVESNLTIMTVLDRLSDDHRRFADVIGVLRSLAEQLEVGDDTLVFDDGQALAGQLRDYEEGWHHPAEQVLFDALADFSLEPEVAGALRRAAAEHESIETAAWRIAEDVEQIESGALGEVSALREAIVEFCDSQSAHMNEEEEVIFGAALQYLDANAWQRVSATLGELQAIRKSVDFDWPQPAEDL